MRTGTRFTFRDEGGKELGFISFDDTLFQRELTSSLPNINVSVSISIPIPLVFLQFPATKWGFVFKAWFENTKKFYTSNVITINNVAAITISRLPIYSCDQVSGSIKVEISYHFDGKKIRNIIV